MSEAMEKEREHALQGALAELRTLGAQDEALESNARKLEVGASISGDLRDGGTWTLERESEIGYRVKTDSDSEDQ